MNRPDSVRQIRKRVRALRIGDCRDLLVALSCGHGGSRNGQAAKRDLAMLLGRDKIEHNQAGSDKRPKDATNHKLAPLIFGRSFDVIDDDHFNRSLLRFQFQAELLLQGRE